MEDWIGIYKGLRLPIMGIVFFIVVYYYYKPSNKKTYEDIRFTMLDDDVDPNLSRKVRKDMAEKAGEKAEKELSSKKKV